MHQKMVAFNRKKIKVKHLSEGKKLFELSLSLNGAASDEIINLVWPEHEYGGLQKKAKFFAPNLHEKYDNYTDALKKKQFA